MGRAAERPMGRRMMRRLPETFLQGRACCNNFHLASSLSSDAEAARQVATLLPGKAFVEAFADRQQNPHARQLARGRSCRQCRGQLGPTQRNAYWF